MKHKSITHFIVQKQHQLICLSAKAHVVGVLSYEHVDAITEKLRV